MVLLVASAVCVWVEGRQGMKLGVIGMSVWVASTPFLLVGLAAGLGF